MKRMFEVILTTLSLGAFASAIWIVVPAPAPAIWLFAVAASEWSLWIAIVALCCIVSGLFYLILGDGGRASLLSVIFASIAVGISLYPFASMYQIANENGVSLSFSRYFSGVTTSAKVADFTTHSFTTVEGTDLKLDVYLPTEINSNNGASIVVVHGGSWAGGERSDFPQWNVLLAANGYTVFDIDYRLSPQPNYLTATGDVKCALFWVQQNAGQFNIDGDRIAILGRSAGAHLALLAAYSAGDERLPSSCNAKTPSTKVRAVVSLYAPIELLWAYDNPANEMVINGPLTLSNFLGGAPDAEATRNRYILASPTSHVTAITPPTLMIHGGQDQLVRTENLFYLDKKLTTSKVPHQSLLFPYAQHGFDYNKNGWASQVTQKVILEFLRENTETKSASN